MPAIANPAKFATAGNAVFTLVSKVTEARFTYRMRVSEDDASLHFVQVLSGPDNTSDYRYLGIVRRGVFMFTKKSPSREAPSSKAFDWFWRCLASSRLPLDKVEVHHEGRCGRCGRALTVPASIQSGFGPECISKI